MPKLRKNPWRSPSNAHAEDAKVKSAMANQGALIVYQLQLLSSGILCFIKITLTESTVYGSRLDGLAAVMALLCVARRVSDLGFTPCSGEFRDKLA